MFELTLVNALLLFVTGLATGSLNVIAGGGSFLSLPMLIFLGLPPTLANGTNRVAILLQNVGAVWGFHRHRVLDWKLGLLAAVPAALGGVVGSFIALAVGDDAFRRILAFLMVVISLWTLWDPLKKKVKVGGFKPPELGTGMRWGLGAGFFLVGLYGGFVQAGVGFLVLTATTLVGLDLVRGNALKVLVILIFTGISLGIFAASGQVSWVPGLLLAVGTILGGLVGVRLTVLKGHRWVKAVVTAAVVIFALKLWLAP
jgi:uncharacterized membrane protein YfcA